MTDNKGYFLIDKLEADRSLSRNEWLYLFHNISDDLSEYLFLKAEKKRQDVFGDAVYIRGLIEFTNHCHNDCYYCGIRKSNVRLDRYRLSKKEIMECCREGYRLGFRTFVLQGGEDRYYHTDDICEIISGIKAAYPDCAVTLSIGECSKKDYEAFFKAGADRYLLRHETISSDHYAMLHPKNMSYDNRISCLYNLKDIGYQVGCGFMVGSPGQTPEMLADEMLFLKAFNPHMVGIGPFIPHHQTPFASKPPGTLKLTLYCLGLIRLMLSEALLPATTALGTISPDGRELGIKAGANVVMPNLSPISARKKYELYDNKLYTGEESAQSLDFLKLKMKNIGMRLVVDRGDSPMINNRRK